MECLKEENPSLLLRRDERKLTRCPRLELNANTMDAINEANHKREKIGHGSVRVKVVVSKQQLKQLMAASNGKLRSNAIQSSSIQQLLHVLKRKVEAERTTRRVRWRPGLQSIPEEVTGDTIHTLGEIIWS
ncbi:hypothetical protein LUZ62_051408 [Rhynchospora pubera]|uniref:Uncharacterized protein n=1 Tax=Rhynchospora pubera TaxID=906938 RepID=A0AAV8GC96_9POAL|nr:hypothetical protein LUZ62_081063 [Rhynchospora pubera]KAJ4800162.1 hypothetical protein LUZ62_051408 [Rhynchospora pubera]